MDQTLALLLHGCNLARHLESNLLPHINNSEALSKSCDEIIAVFLACKERLSLSDDPQQGGLFGQPPWLMKCRTTPTPDQVATTSTGKAMEVAAVGPSSSSGGVRFGGGGAVASSSSTASQQRPRRRRDEADRRTMRVPIPRMGPEDGFTWRKYGQKEILGSRFPRGYFRCTHQKLYNCRAKKQVQRLDHDPDTYEVTYRGHHTCHMSATAPSVGPPEEPHAGPSATSALQQVITAAAQQQQSTARWAMEFRLGRGVGVGGGGGGRDQHHHQQQVDFPVSDMAAAMFSSGSSSTNASMDLIFNAAMDAHDQDKQSDDRGKGKA